MVWLREIPHVALTHAHQDHVGGSGGKFPHELFCDWNNNSLVVHLQFGSRSILLPGTLKNRWNEKFFRKTLRKQCIPMY